jgi:hypothetical protein
VSQSLELFGTPATSNEVLAWDNWRDLIIQAKVDVISLTTTDSNRRDATGNLVARRAIEAGQILEVLDASTE